jgi:glycerol-3-phosphate cytidylyltransferase
MGTRVGYTAGVFDMFHVGHLNIIEQTRALCDHLIVGVASDALVMRLKNKTPVIGELERMAIVSAIRGVDEVVLQEHTDYIQDWHALRYDILTKGDDWKGTPKWLAIEAELATFGARVAFIPYTRNVSSTLLRRALEDVHAA